MMMAVKMKISIILKKKEKENKRTNTKKKMMQGAKLVARAEARRLWKWVLAGPTSLRVLTFFVWNFFIISGAIGFWIEIFNKFRFCNSSNVYILLAGILISSLEIKSYYVPLMFAAKSTIFFIFYH